MTRKQRIIRIIKTAAKLREKRPLNYDAIDMIWCALSWEINKHIANAEWELGLPIGEAGDGVLTREDSELHRRIAELH